MILRRANKHFNEIVVQAVVQLMLQMPAELRMIEVACVNRQHVGVYRHGRVLQIDQNLDRTVILTCRKSKQRMIVEL